MDYLGSETYEPTTKRGRMRLSYFSVDSIPDFQRNRERLQEMGQKDLNLHKKEGRETIGVLESNIVTFNIPDLGLWVPISRNVEKLSGLRRFAMEDSETYLGFLQHLSLRGELLSLYSPQQLPSSRQETRSVPVQINALPLASLLVDGQGLLGDVKGEQDLFIDRLHNVRALYNKGRDEEPELRIINLYRAKNTQGHPMNGNRQDNGEKPYEY